MCNSNKNEELSMLKKEIEDFFTKHAMDARIIYRTCSEKFGNESPHNLLPKAILSNHVMIYLDFDGCASIESLNYLIAFPDADSDKLPQLLNPRLGGDRPKADLSKVPSNYRFKNVKELFANYFDRFPENQGKDI